MKKIDNANIVFFIFSFQLFKSEQIKKSAPLFSDCIDKILPLSIVEGLQARLDYYNLMLKNWKLEQVHSFTGYYYNENFKIFALLAKRNGANLVGHVHGANNYQYKSYKWSNELRFLDYYTTYGKHITDHIKSTPECKRVNYISTCLLYTSPSPRDQRGSRMPS